MGWGRSQGGITAVAGRKTTQPLKPADGVFDGDGAPEPCSAGGEYPLECWGPNPARLGQDSTLSISCGSSPCVCFGILEADSWHPFFLFPMAGAPSFSQVIPFICSTLWNSVECLHSRGSGSGGETSDWLAERTWCHVAPPCSPLQLLAFFTGMCRATVLSPSSEQVPASSVFPCLSAASDYEGEVAESFDYLVVGQSAALRVGTQQ